MHEDTIVAPATGSGETPIAVIRISGPAATDVLAGAFRAADGTRTQAARTHELMYGIATASDDSEIDEVLAVVMRAPRSFTGEDVCEIHCHGGSTIVAAILDSCIAAGARLAEPGEFSRRAFLNGRIDLAQAEAVCDLIRARTELARKLAFRQLRGGLSSRVAEIRENLVNTAAEIEARLDFPEEDAVTADDQKLCATMRIAVEQLQSLLRGFDSARLVREGARIVIAGSPNAGKSSLFNALVGRERAIVTPHPGTTRDTIESTVEIAGVAVTLVDTAGLREARDEIERIGIERTGKELEQADLVIRVVDAHEDTLITTPEDNEILVLNKADLCSGDRAAQLLKKFPHAVRVSATTREGLERLETQLAVRLRGNLDEDTMQLATARHADCVRGAFAALNLALGALERNESGEFVMIDLRESILHLDELLGTRLDDAILDRIFSRFCMGK